MLKLIPVSLIEGTNAPFVWYCSDCRAVFSLERMSESPSIMEIHRVDSNFANHCKQTHPDTLCLLDWPSKHRSAQLRVSKTLEDC
jgi:hypothetical protein